MDGKIRCWDGSPTFIDYHDNEWSKWIIPAQTYLVAECAADKYGDVFDSITSDPNITIVGTVHERYPKPGNPNMLELWFPVAAGDESARWAK